MAYRAEFEACKTVVLLYKSKCIGIRYKLILVYK